MSARDELVERIARAIIIGSGGERAADHAQEYNTANWEDAKRSAREVIPIIDAEIAAERERCAAVAEWINPASTDYQRGRSDAAAKIRSQPCKN